MEKEITAKAHNANLTGSIEIIELRDKPFSIYLGREAEKKLKKPKRKTVGQLKKVAWDLFSKYIRFRDCLRTTGCSSFGLCITCGKRYHFKLLQAGHYIAGRHNANLFNERGCHAQCYNCNINLKGNTPEYRRQIIKLYGEGADEEIEAEARQSKQYKPLELEELIESLKAKIKAREGWEGT